MEHRILISLVAALLLGACIAPNAGVLDAKERGILSAKMVNLSSAVDTYFDSLSETPIDTVDNILRNATRHDSRLLAPEFGPYLFKTQYQNPYAVLLLCTKDGKQAIMEDAGCSARLDRQVTDAAPCEFTVVVKSDCQVEGGD
jgi:hypothetical protein